ncbi:motility associated factor glycosyltransferase family protein [Clostridium sp.]|uniref:motility associated factor glycosyltransferase family protein n=1 Tax=Clostridium sp. TaxID=1506 RepID=UPI002FC64847
MCKFEKKISKDGYDILHVTNNKGKKIYSCSFYKVSRAIDKIVSEVNDNKNKPFIFIYGLSCGEYIDRILEIDIEGKIYILEYFKELIDEIREKYSENLDRLNFISFDELDNLGFYTEDTYGAILTYGNYMDIFPDEILKATDIIKKATITAVLNHNTIKRFSYDWVENILSNIPYIIESNNIESLKVKHKNKPAVIVSAGSSLDKELEYLKKEENKFVIISGGRTLPTLKRKNIKVDYTCVIDGANASYEVIKEGLDYETNLVYSEVINKNILDNYNGKKTYYSYGSYNSVISSILGYNVDEIQNVGGSVAHTCIELARYMGCNPIIMLGQDLAYTNNKYHADEASITDKNIIRRFDLLVENIYGENIPTDYSLDNFRVQLERYIYVTCLEDPSLKFINCSDGGAKIKGADFEEFKLVANKILENNFKSENIEKNIEVDRKKVILVIEEMKKQSLNIKKIAKQSIASYEELKKVYFTNKSRVSFILNDLEKSDQLIKKNTLCLDMIWSLVYEELNIINKNHNRSKQVDNKDVLDSVISEGLMLNTALLKNIDIMIPLIDRAIIKLTQRGE